MAAGNSISTHAPAGGATDYWNMARRDGLISTHAPAGGATWGAPVLCRQDLISTHAPAGGATSARPARPHGLRYFYSRPCGRGDFAACLSFCPRHRFLLTPLREGRLQSLVTVAPVFSVFLLTPLREGRRLRIRWQSAGDFLFLLTPLREGRRLRCRAGRSPRPHFYSRPCGRGDRVVQAHTAQAD